MKIFWTPKETYHFTQYATEQELENAIVEVQAQLFGRSRIYLSVKRRIGKKGKVTNIPDGYLLDLSGHEPRLYVVEVELNRHDHLEHIAVQILQFSISFSSEPHVVKQVLIGALQSPEYEAARKRCEAYVAARHYRNIDELVEKMIYNRPFAPLLIIDEMPDDLSQVVTKQFKFGVEVLELARYKNRAGNYVYHFEPFLEDLAQDLEAAAETQSTAVEAVDAEDIDTIVVPAREEGFMSVFLGENAWRAVRIHGSMLPQIKYIAAYQIRPISAITYIAPVASIEPWQDSGKYMVKFSEPAQPIGPIKLVENGRAKALQNIRYTTLRRLEAAKTLDDVW